MDSFKCMICGYVHIGEEPPANCPICDAPKEEFEKIDHGKTGRVEKAVESLAKDVDFEKVVILGSGIAALTAAKTLRENNNHIEINMITAEKRLPYYRLNLTRYLAGEILEGELNIHDQYWYDEHRITVYRNKVITNINVKDKRVETADGFTLEYDRLIVAIGAHPFVPPINGAHQKGVTSLRDIDDANYIIDSVTEGTKVFVIGGGILGLEAAGALAKRGAEVTVGEGSSWLMPRQLNKRAAAQVEASLTRQGIKVEYEFRSTDIVKEADGFKIKGKDGREVKADLVLLATGVRSNTYLARKAELEVDRGIVVSDCLKTSEEGIYAIGDVSEHYGIAYGLWTVANYQGSIAALNVLGVKTPFGGIPRSNALKVLDMDVYSIGEISAADGSYEMLEKSDNTGYIMFMVKDGSVVGSITVGYKELTGKIKKLVEDEVHFSPGQLASVHDIISLL